MVLDSSTLGTDIEAITRNCHFLNSSLLYNLVLIDQCVYVLHAQDA